LERLQELERRVAEQLERPAQGGSALQAFLLDTAREVWLLGAHLGRTAADPRKLLARIALLGAAGQTDELGVDERLATLVRETLLPLTRLWLRPSERGGAGLPERGGVLVLLNRSAWPLPVEALALWALIGEGRSWGRRVHVLWDGRALDLPFAGDFLQRLGVFAATPENCAALLERGWIVIAFPEGRAALGKTYERRYRLAAFHDAALLGAAVGAGAHIVPGAVVGNEESFPVLGSLAGVPLTATFPWSGLLGLLPLPIPWLFKLGAPVEYARVEDGEAAVDDLGDAVRGRMQAMLAELLAGRRSIVTG